MFCKLYFKTLKLNFGWRNPLPDQYPPQVYRIDVFTQERNWCVYRRYSEFRKLHDKISDCFKMFKGSFPPKQLSGNLSPAIIEQRRSSLEHYLLKIVNW